MHRDYEGIGYEGLGFRVGSGLRRVQGHTPEIKVETWKRIESPSKIAAVITLPFWVGRGFMLVSCVHYAGVLGQSLL